MVTESREEQSATNQTAAPQIPAQSSPTALPLQLLYLNRNARVVLFQILQADLQVQLPCTSDDVLPRLLNDALKRPFIQQVRLLTAMQQKLSRIKH